MTMYYSEAMALMERARNPERGKPLQNNTRLFAREFGGETFYAVRLHNTDVVRIYADGTYELNSGGYVTVTTQDRINTYAPARVYSAGKYALCEDDECLWNLPLEPDPADPDPGRPDRTVPKPFVATDPGACPKDDGRGCVAGQRHAWTNIERVRISPLELRRSDRPSIACYDQPKLDAAPTSARRVLAWISAIEPKYAHAYVERAVTHVLDYIEAGGGAPYWHKDQHGVEAKQCDHCKAYQVSVCRWQDAKRTWDTYCTMLDKYTDMAGWRAAWKEDGKRWHAGHRTYREWVARNYVPFEDGIVVDSDGHARRADYTERLARIVAEQERGHVHRSMKAERQRVKTRLRRQRERDPNYLGNQLVKDLQNIRSSLGGRVTA